MWRPPWSATSPFVERHAPAQTPPALTPPARRQRARDIVLLRLVGATRWQVARSQLVEFALLSASVALAAFAAGALAARLVVTRLFEFPFSPDWPGLALIPAGAVALAIAAAFVAALPALNARPAEGLRAL